MTHAVIDLISSSPPPLGVAPPRPAARQPTATSHGSQSRAPEASQSFDLDAFASEFNSTGDLDDPFASSPSFPALSRKDAAPAVPRITDTHDRGSTTVTGHRQARTSGVTLSAEFEIFSDDFDTSVDLDNRTLAESSGNKRRRLSPSPRIADPLPPSKAPTISLTSSPAKSTCKAPKRTAALDLTSPDPFASSPACPATTVPRPPSGQQPRDSSPNPFDSTPAPRPAADTQPRAHSPNPFDSTPPTQDAGPQLQSRPCRPHVFDSSPRQPRPPVSQRRRQEWDPISSSAPEVSAETHVRPVAASGRTGRSNVIDIESSSDAGFGDDGTSDDDLPDLNKLTARCVKPRERTTLSRSRSDVISSKNRSKPTQPKKSTGERARERETKAAAKEAEKEKKRIQREKDKEEKAREKAQAAALAEVNKVRTDKKISTPEMLVDMADSLDAELRTQVETFLEPLDVQSTNWASPVEGVIKWRRKVTSEFNEDMGRWEPVPRRIEEEKHMAVILRADKFVEIALTEELDDHVAKVSTAFPNHHIIYLIEGMTGWFRKNRSKRNRQFTSGVRAQESASTSSSAASSSTAANRRRRNAASAASEYVSEDLIEDALLHLQVMHDVLIHHTNLGLETAQWIVSLTQHISTIPYRKQRDEATMGAGFCMDSGQVKTGEDAADTYVKMLQEIARITAPIAWGVKAEFGSVSQLVNGLVEGGPDRLANVKKSANKDGAVSDRTIGQAVSKRLHKVFTGRDENSADV